MIVVVLLLSNVYFNKDEATREDRIASVMDATFDESGLFSFQMVDTDPTIFIEMDETKSEKEFLEYLEKNMSQSDLSHYNIEITKRNLQEVQREHLSILKKSEGQELNTFN
jgi:hypothetical protein